MHRCWLDRTAEELAQASLRPDRIPQGSQTLAHRRNFKRSLEAISELNQFLLRPDREDQRTGAQAVIAARRLQRNFTDSFITEAVEDLWETWMRHADKALEDDARCSASKKSRPNQAPQEE